MNRNQFERAGSRLSWSGPATAMLLAALLGTAGMARAQTAQSAAETARSGCLYADDNDQKLREANCEKAGAALRQAGSTDNQLRLQVEGVTGDLKMGRQNYAGAKAAFERAKILAVGNHPVYGDILMRIADACLGLKQPDCGLTAFEEAGKVGFTPRADDAYMLAHLLMIKYNKAQAVQILSRLADSDESDPVKSLYNHATAEVLVSWGRFSEANNYYIRAADKTERASVWNAACWHHIVNVSSPHYADYFCDGALERDDKNAGIWDSSGLRYLLRDAAWQAFKAYDQAVKLDPDHAHALYGRGLANAKMGKHAEAQADKRRALAINPALEKTYASYFD